MASTHLFPQVGFAFPRFVIPKSPLRVVVAMKHVAMMVLILGSAGSVSAQGTASDYQRAANLFQQTRGKVLNAQVTPRWSDDGQSLEYTRELAGGQRERVRVSLANGRREVLKEARPAEERRPAEPPRRPGRRAPGGSRSPDGTREAFIKDNNVWLRDRATNTESQLSRDGTASDRYTGRFFWSPRGDRLIALKSTTGGDRRVTLVESTPRDQLQPKVQTYFYLKPGDEIPQPRPRLFDIPNAKEIPVSTELFANPWDVSYEHWSPDGERFYFLYNQRGHQVLRLLMIDANTGHVRVIVNEVCNTFFDYTNKLYLRYLDATNEILWMSERSGWNHLYLLDATTGVLKNAITAGEWNVRGVDHFDPDRRELTIRTVGYFPEQDPYHVHWARVSFDGKPLLPLTQGDGTHTVTFSPDRRHYLATYSRVDRAPVTELRRAIDGELITVLEKADISALEKSGWQPPERFVAPGRDGKTPMHGIIVRPSNFDPKKKYRVIESIYAGPHDHHVPKNFRPVLYEQRMAELGFIVVKVDGMGTNWRSKAFHDVCWKNLGDSGFPDRIAWIQAAAKQHPEMDISEGVGIFGGSAGGQSTVRAMTEYPDFYVVGVADCGCHDNRMDKIWWNEQWMGWPVGPHYEAQSNVTNAHKIRGKLMLVVGELDRNVDPASTLQVAAALIKADRDFEMLVIPGGGHGAAESPYGSRRRADFFVRHLLGVEPRAR